MTGASKQEHHETLLEWIYLRKDMKRKAVSEASGLSKKRVLTRTRTPLSAFEAKQRFRSNLFQDEEQKRFVREYANSTPYKHAVINNLVEDGLLRGVRHEIRAHVHFTPKETDIYKIHQSGDLANLDGCDDSELKRLPSLLKLRDAIYSEAFRDYVSAVTGCGALSGTKTDMAVNVYTPGCFLLCHDDVIGSRKVSYILYLTDPDDPWKPEWGGALRLYPTTEMGEAKIPAADAGKTIPPAWNQLSFFAVQPGESFHDVEEVYHAPLGDTNASKEDERRVRMAISGWFHIPQLGEVGHVKGAEAELTRNSGLAQLSGNPAQYDEPQTRPVAISESTDNGDEDTPFDEADLEFLLKYIAPTYLIPETLAGMAEHFEEQSSITVSRILSKSFSVRLREYIIQQEASSLPATSEEIHKSTPWRVARPPHKHRYLFQQPVEPDQSRALCDHSPITELLDVLLPSRQFRSWLQRATGCDIVSRDALARRFRKGVDYTLATGHQGQPRLEVNLGITPSLGWGDDDDDEEEEEEEEEDKEPESSSNNDKNGKAAKASRHTIPKETPRDVGGHEVYMRGDDNDDHNDAAIYRSGQAKDDDDDDDAMLFFQAAAWEKMTIVLRDNGVLRFVKYVSESAPGDRWDISATFGIAEEGEGAGEEKVENVDEDEDEDEIEEEDEFNGFSDSCGESD